ncbi:MAG: hypothetical protein HC838_10435 [Spirulinaceae cyanobacterium RM2_2_10]|nr:hypothetical protein [Spirulinaceae cyanobacterium RM2_2_10]
MAAFSPRPVVASNSAQSLTARSALRLLPTVLPPTIVPPVPSGRSP